MLWKKIFHNDSV